jgi:hypothetical protein
MPVLLCGVGVFALIAGLIMVGFGVPINEFSFGNTLISAGTTAIIGGLVIFALGVTVGQLRRITEAIAHQGPSGFAQAEVSEPLAISSQPAAPSSPRAPFSARPRAEPAPLGHGPFSEGHSDASGGSRRDQSLAPTLRNPEQAPVTVDDEISLSPPHPAVSAPPAAGNFSGRPRPPAAPTFGATTPDMDEEGREPILGRRSPAPSMPSVAPSPARPPQAARFDAMWPAEAKPEKAPISSDIKPNLPPPRAGGSPKPAEPEVQKPRAVAILKSGVVDGMGYTLYVDGSIEAELPQGTLRFASINELRSHLEKNS